MSSFTFQGQMHPLLGHNSKAVLKESRIQVEDEEASQDVSIKGQMYPLNGHDLEIELKASEIQIEVKGAEANQESQLSQMVNKVLNHKPHSIYFVEGANALSKESGILKSALTKVWSDVSSSAKNRSKNNSGNAMSFCFVSDSNEGDVHDLEDVDDLTPGSTKMKFLPLPNDCNIRRRFMHRLLEKFNGPCLRIIFGDSKEIVQSISAKCADDSSIGEDDRPLLIVNNEVELHSVINSFKGSFTNMAEFGKEIYSKAGMGKKEGTKIVTYFKDSSWKIDVHNTSKGCVRKQAKAMREDDKRLEKDKEEEDRGVARAKGENDSRDGNKKARKKDDKNFLKARGEDVRRLAKAIRLSICRGSNPSIPWLMDSSEEIARSFVSSDRFSKKSRMLVFPNMWKVEKDENQVITKSEGRVESKKNSLSEKKEPKKIVKWDLFNQYSSKVHMPKSFPNVNKIFLTEEDLNGNRQINDGDDERTDESVKREKLIYTRLKDRISIENIKKYEDLFPSNAILETEKEAIIKSHPVLRFRFALKKKDHKLAEDILSSQALDIYPYLYCNMGHHWEDSTWEKKMNGCIGNSATSRLTNWVVEKVFEEDGRPNLKIANPIQALMINRLLYRQIEFVKILWRYDKKNSLTNALLLWIITDGIIKGNEKIFNRTQSTEDFQKFKKYIDDAVVQLLKSAEVHYGETHDNPTRYKCQVFKQNRLIDIAGIVKHEHFFTQPLSRRTVAYMWGLNSFHMKQEKAGGNSQAEWHEKVKPYFHMIIYLMVYISVAYSTIRWKTKESIFIQWATFVFVFSLAVDEVCQLELDEISGTYRSFCMRITRDTGDGGWGAVGESGRITLCIQRWWSDPWNKWDLLSMILYFVAFIVDVKESRFLFAFFSFIWCLKFYQFLRKFKAVGIYIIIVQKMIPHFWQFGLVALVPICGYGIFMLSLMPHSHDFEISNSTTIYGTPKIPVYFEFMAILGMCAFMMFGSILLMNLLIAVFSGVYDEIREKSESLWSIHEFQLLEEFKRKPRLPVPLSLPQNLIYIATRFLSKEQEHKAISDKERVKSEKRQEKIMNDYLYNEEKSVESNYRLKTKVVEEVDSRIKELGEKHEHNTKELAEKHENQVDRSFSGLESRIRENAVKHEQQIKELAEKHQQQFDLLQEQNNDMKNKLEEIIRSLQLNQ